MIGDKTHACLYVGHGQSKVVYKVTDEAQVLKLTARKDQEPYVCQELSHLFSAEQPDLKICPTIYKIGRCQEQDQRGRPMGQWFAWLAEYVTLLDKHMQRLNVDRKTCLKIALYKQVIAAQHGLLLSDNNLFNFGVVDHTVVIIDTGSRTVEPRAIQKSRMNTSIRKWWYKLKWQCGPGELEEIRAIWQLHSLDEIAQQFCNMHLRPESTRPAPPPFPPPPFIGSVEKPAGAITQAPSVWALLEEPPANDALEPPATDALQWLLEKFLFGRLASLKLLQTGETVPLEQEEEQPSHIRLQTLINLTEQKRSKWIQNTNDILPDDTMKLLLDDWKADYTSWMNQKAQDEWWSVEWNKSRQWTRVRFRNFLFKICGCYHLVIFWLRVQASWTSLCIFQQVFDEERTGVWEEEAKDKMERAVQAVRDAQ